MLAENAESHGGLRHNKVASVFPCLCRIVILDIPSVHSNAEYIATLEASAYSIGLDTNPVMVPAACVSRP